MAIQDIISRRTILTGGLLGAATMGLGSHPVHAASFTDVPVGAAFYREINWVADNRIVDGFPDGTFRPLLTVNRGFMAVYLYRLAGRPSYTAPTRAYFVDVPLTSQYFREISWLADQGVTTGYNDGTFRPGNAIHRDAMAAFFYRIAGEPGYVAPAVSPFTDVPHHAAYYKEICWMASMNISTGYGDGTYRPLDPVRRDAMSAFLYRFHFNVLSGS
ncbi:S-layer homology domain-containing protein [Kocuria sp.]|uniref:S-layer homology domain-containing protein n=1 Tax=Kocuria sp. TaxID=1871328 RepID=UPI0026E09DC2|nr:S-layer homology domain-containing protein [Kocuria sp.]MDO5619000.1 S-layer homology domain-containing protein [Kocuria sp.]